MTLRLAAVLLVLAQNCLLAEEPAPYEPDDADLALTAFFRGLHQSTPPQAPERFAVNRIGERDSHRVEFGILEGRIAATPAMREAARERLGKLKAQIELARQWPLPTAMGIPRCAAPPVIDGRGDDQPWADSLVMRDEYPIDHRQSCGNDAGWRLMWDAENLYALGSFPDRGIEAYTYAADATMQPWNGDCLEIFILPDMRLKVYWEIIISANGSVFDGLHRSNDNGGFSFNPTDDLRGLRTATAARPGGHGYVVEAAIPFRELPGYLRGNMPQVGDPIHFMLVRTNDGAKFTPYPLLFDGHNIFGFIPGVLR